MIDELRGAKAADFDNRYISQQIDAHKEALSLMQNYAKNGDNVAVKGFASDTAPVVQDHLNMAESISKGMSK
jgi:putative membrane protein